MSAELTEEDRAELEHMRREAARHRGAQAGVPRKWQGATWADIDLAESDARRAAVEHARRWAAEEEPGGLFLTGPVGIGKTRIAATAAVYRSQLYPVRWVPVADLMIDLSRGFQDPARAKALDRLDAGKQRALILDDLDKIKPSEWQVAPLYTAINGWVEEELPLIVTANKSLEELEDFIGGHFGQAIASRLAEHCDVFEIRGRDRRVEP